VLDEVSGDKNSLEGNVFKSLFGSIDDLLHQLERRIISEDPREIAETNSAGEIGVILIWCAIGEASSTYSQ